MSLVASKSALHKVQEVVVGTVKGVITHPVGSAEKAVEQAKGGISLGRMVAGQVTRSAAGVVTSRLPGRGGQAPAHEPLREVTTDGTGTTSSRSDRPAPPKPAGKKAPAKKAPAKKAPAKKQPTRVPVTDVATELVKEQAAHQPVPQAPAAPESPIDAAADPSAVDATPSDVARTVAKKAPAKKATTKKAPASKAAAKKTPARPSTPSAKLPARKAVPKTAAEVLEDTSVPTPVGTTGADVAHNPDTTDHDLRQPGTEPLMDPATTNAVASEAAVGARAADPDKG